jgi:protein-disulfide isomerase
MDKKKISVPIPSIRTATPLLILLIIGGAYLIGRFQGQLELLKGGQTQIAGTGIGTTPQGGTQPNPGTNPGQPQQPTSGTASVDDDPFMGDKNAPITMIEFSDFECPFCKSFYDQTLPQIKKNYIDTGKVKFVYRDLPLPFHDPMATKEAIASNCAREQGGDEKFFEYHDEIFNRTKSNGNGLNDEDLQTIAQDVGLNMSQFDSCIQDDAQDQEVKNDIAAAQAAGATGTPGFVIGKSTPDGNINGQLVIGAQPYAAFEALLNTLN